MENVSAVTAQLSYLVAVFKLAHAYDALCEVIVCHLPLLVTLCLERVPQADAGHPGHLLQAILPHTADH